MTGMHPATMDSTMREPLDRWHGADAGVRGEWEWQSRYDCWQHHYCIFGTVLSRWDGTTAHAPAKPRRCEAEDALSHRFHNALDMPSDHEAGDVFVVKQSVNPLPHALGDPWGVVVRRAAETTGLMLFDTAVAGLSSFAHQAVLSCAGSRLSK